MDPSDGLLYIFGTEYSVEYNTTWGRLFGYTLEYTSAIVFNMARAWKIGSCVFARYLVVKIPWYFGRLELNISILKYLILLNNIWTIFKREETCFYIQSPKSTRILFEVEWIFHTKSESTLSSGKSHPLATPLIQWIFCSFFHSINKYWI